ncbi:MAG: glutamine amidotransferase-related protein [Bacteroidota bacterium]
MINILLIDCGSRKVPDIEIMLQKEGALAQTISLEKSKSENIQVYNGVVISGAPVLLTETDQEKFLSEISWIQQFKKPVLGICFGHQLMGLLNGAKIYRCEEDRKEQKILSVAPSSLFHGLPAEFVMKEDHCEAISLPRDFQLAASSVVCENEAMQHNKLPWFGVQFHPEVSGENGRIIFRNFFNICKEHL